MAAFLLTASLAGAALAGVAAAKPMRPALELRAGKYSIEAECVETPELRMQGLMSRQTLPSNRGMLFIFPAAHRQCMWMHNMHLPLSVAFIADDGTIVNIAEMQPDTDSRYCADRPVHYALEMNAGWFAKRGIVPGARIRGIEKAPLGL